MGAITRGIRNTFRNPLRTLGFAVIIAVSMALAFSMLLAYKAVGERGNQLKRQIGTNARVLPIGADFSMSSTPFTDQDAEKLSRLPNVTAVTKHLTFVAQSQQEQDAAKKAASESGQMIESGGEFKTTSLSSALDWSDLGESPHKKTKSPPIPIGIEGPSSDITLEGRPIQIVQGKPLDQTSTGDAVIGKTLAEKNKLSIGSTFTIDKKTFKVAGIFDSETPTSNNSVMIPFAAAGEILGKKEIVQLTVTASSIETLDAVIADVKKTLGEKRVDVMTQQPEAAKIVASLKNIQNISIVTVFIALGTCDLIIMLTMVLVVRERKKEIGTLKALGATNVKVVNQFVSEALTLTLISTLIGMGVAALTSNSILQGLVSAQVQDGSQNPGMASGGMVQQIGGPAAPSTQELVQGISALIDWQFILLGFGIAIVIALLAAAIPAFVIAKVRPAQVLRSN